MSAKIYTRTGDKGQTSLFGGKRVPKYHVRVEAYGTVDELNSAIGVAVAQAKSKLQKAKSTEKVIFELEKIQNDLFDIGSTLATPSGRDVLFLEKRTQEMEKLIDVLTERMPILRNFILPGGSIASSYFHVARTVCRRAERRIGELSSKEKIPQEIPVYMNRLSDLLFTIARFVNHVAKKKEILWTKRSSL